MDQAMVYTIVTLLLGALLLFFGLRLMKVAVAIIGFLLGYGLASSLGAQYGWEPTIIVVAGLLVGLLLASIAFWFYRIAVGISIALFCAGFVYTLALSSGLDAPLALGAGAVAGIVAFIVVQLGRVVDILFAIVTSLQGASLLIASVIALLDRTLIPELQTNSLAIIMQTQGGWALAWIALAVVGVIFQIKSHLQQAETSSAPRKAE